MKMKWQASSEAIHNPVPIIGIMMNISPFTSKFKMRKLDLRNESTLRTLSKFLFAAYVIFFLWVVIFKCNWIDTLKVTYGVWKDKSFTDRLLNTSEFDSMKYFISIGDILSRPVLEPFFNLVIFAPIGLYITYFQKRQRIINTFFLCFAASFLMESIQIFTLIGGFSYFDLVLNTLGGVIGFFILKLINKKKFTKALNVATISFLSVFAPIAVFAVVNTIANIGFYIDVLLRRI